MTDVYSASEVPAGHVLDQGSGSAILLLHGTAPGATALSNFASTIPALSGHRVLAPDLIGFGASPNDPLIGIGPAVWQEQAWQILDERGIDRIVVLGNATGSRIALEMAHQYPNRIDGLILISARIRPSQSETQTLLRNYTPELVAMRELLAKCFVSDESSLTEELVRERYEVSARPGAHDALQRAFAELRTPGLTPEELSTVEHPALVLHGRHDKVVPYGNSVELADLLPRADLHVLGDVGHWLQKERAAEVNHLIGLFMNRLTS